MGITHSMKDGQMEEVLDSGDKTTQAMREIEKNLARMEIHAKNAKESSERMNAQAEQTTKSIEHISDTLVIKSDAALYLFSEAMETLAVMVDELSYAVSNLKLDDVAQSLPKEVAPLLVPIIILLMIQATMNSRFGFLLSDDPAVKDTDANLSKVVTGFAILHVVVLSLVAIALVCEGIRQYYCVGAPAGLEEEETGEQEEFDEPAAEPLSPADEEVEDDAEGGRRISVLSQDPAKWDDEERHRNELLSIQVELAICKAKLKAITKGSVISDYRRDLSFLDDERNQAVMGKTRSTPGGAPLRMQRQNSALPMRKTATGGATPKRNQDSRRTSVEVAKDTFTVGIQDAPDLRPKLEPLSPSKEKEPEKEKEQEKEKKPPYPFLTKKPGAKGGRSASSEEGSESQTSSSSVAPGSSSSIDRKTRASIVGSSSGLKSILRDSGRASERFDSSGPSDSVKFGDREASKSQTAKGSQSAAAFKKRNSVVAGKMQKMSESLSKRGRADLTGFASSNATSIWQKRPSLNMSIGSLRRGSLSRSSQSSSASSEATASSAPKENPFG